MDATASMRTIEWANNHLDVRIFRTTFGQMRFINRIQYVVASIVWTSNIGGLMMNSSRALAGIHLCLVWSTFRCKINVLWFLTVSMAILALFSLLLLCKFPDGKHKLVIDTDTVLDEYQKQVWIVMLNKFLLDSRQAIDWFHRHSDTAAKGK